MEMHTDYHLYSSIEYLPSASKRAVIDLGALQHNWRALREFLSRDESPARPIAVIKADAYGHGAPQCARALLDVGCDFFAVSCIEEAIALRSAIRDAKKDADILILGHTPVSQAKKLAKENLIQTLISPSYTEDLSLTAREQNLTLRTHIALNTGMNRIGFGCATPDEIQKTLDAIEAIARQGNLRIEGMFTHFSTADGDTDADRALFRTQIERYRSVKDALALRGIRLPFHHVCNSAATALSPELHFDGVRAGILLYGGVKYSSLPTLRPVMRLECDVVHVFSLTPGESVGYGAEYTAESERKIAVLPIGYADGLMRAMKGSTVTVKTQTGICKVPLVGRICMDQCMLDVTDTDVSVGDTATLFGNDPEELLTLSERAGTIPYEILCLISSRVKRHYLDTEPAQNKDTL